MNCKWLIWIVGVLVVGVVALSVPGPATARDPESFGPILKKYGLYLLDGTYWRYNPRDTRAYVEPQTSQELHLISKVAPLSKTEVPRVAALVRECVMTWPHYLELRHVTVMFHEPEGGAGAARKATQAHAYAWVGSGRRDGEWTWSGKWRGEDIASPRRTEK